MLDSLTCAYISYIPKIIQYRKQYNTETVQYRKQYNTETMQYRKQYNTETVQYRKQYNTDNTGTSRSPHDRVRICPHLVLCV